MPWELCAAPDPHLGERPPRSGPRDRSRAERPRRAVRRPPRASAVSEVIPSCGVRFSSHVQAANRWCRPVRRPAGPSAPRARGAARPLMRSSTSTSRGVSRDCGGWRRPPCPRCRGCCNRDRDHAPGSAVFDVLDEEARPRPGAPPETPRSGDRTAHEVGPSTARLNQTTAGIVHVVEYDGDPLHAEGAAHVRGKLANPLAGRMHVTPRRLIRELRGCQQGKDGRRRATPQHPQGSRSGLSPRPPSMCATTTADGVATGDPGGVTLGHRHGLSIRPKPWSPATIPAPASPRRACLTVPPGPPTHGHPRPRTRRVRRNG
jgi:hypothetical protein